MNTVSFRSMVMASATALALSLGVNAAQAATGATATQTVNVTATVSSAAVLSLSAATLTFNDATPNGAATPATVAAAEGNITVTAYVRTTSGSAGSLQVKASAATLGGTSGAGNTAVTIPVSRVAANTTSTNFAPITAMSATNQNLSSGTWVSGIYTGTYGWTFQPSWSDMTAAYTGSFVYTLTAP
jgi:hypothetical protein